jgi:rhodanese-related sulfurtransferase
MTEITVQTLKSRIDAGEQLHIIDCREPDEYAEYNMGAQLIPLGKIQGMQIDEIDDLRGEEIIIHCRSGKRSYMACMLLEQMGFSNTVNVTGGILAWKEMVEKQ